MLQNIHKSIVTRMVTCSIKAQEITKGQIDDSQ